MKREVQYLQLLLSASFLMTGCGLQEKLDQNINDPSRTADELVKGSDPFQGTEFQDEEPLPTPAQEATPTPPPSPTPTPPPTATPDPSEPTVEKAQQRLLELGAQKQLLESRIQQMKTIISEQEAGILTDWETLKSGYDKAIREAEESAVEIRYKSVKRRDVNGREYWAKVPYEHENLGANAKVTQINRTFQQHKAALQLRHQDLADKKEILAQAQSQLAEHEANITYIENWINLNGS